MLSKTHRLAKTKDVQKVYARGRSFFSPFYTIRFLNSVDETSRFTVVVSSKVAKQAVVRNRLKRVLREYIRLHLTAFKSGDYMIILKTAAVRLEPKALRQELEKLLVKTKLLC